MERERVWTNAVGEVIAMEGGPERPERGLAVLGAARQGWRARLAHVEMLLSEEQRVNGESLGVGFREALREVREMIDEVPS